MAGLSKRMVWAFALIVWVASPAAARQDPRAALDSYIEKARQEWRVPGVAVAVVKNDSIVYARGFGVREEGKSERVDENTIFAIGSSSKAFTAAALGMLVDEGKVRWDDPAIEHLIGFQLHDPYLTREITIRDMLSHRGGVGAAGLAWTGSGFSRAEILHRLRYQDHIIGLRKRFDYNNEMFLAAGEVIPAITGMSWDQFLKERLFAPLGMTRSGTSVDSLRGVPNVATPHAIIDDRPTPVSYRQIDNIGPAGSINSSARDVAQWVRLHLNQGAYGGRQLLKKETVHELHTPQIVIPLRMYQTTTPEAQIFTYGLGWFLHDYRGRKVVEHGGAIDGMHALVGMIPEEGLGVVILTNLLPHHLPYAVMYRVFDAYLGEPATDWSAQMKASADRASVTAAKAASAPAAVSGPSWPLEKYAGVYESQLYGTVEISIEDSRLVLKRPDSAAKLSHRNHDTFVAEWTSPGLASVLGRTPIQFTLGPAGEVVSFSLSGLANFVRAPANRR